MMVHCMNKRFNAHEISICRRTGSIDNWLSDTIQNVAMQQFTRRVRTAVVPHAVLKCSFYGQADDGLTSVCMREQFSRSPQTKR